MKRLGRNRLREGSGQSEGAGQDGEAMYEGLTDFNADELREFLEADVLDVRADPGFKERLRRALWELLQKRAANEKIDPDEGH